MADINEINEIFINDDVLSLKKISADYKDNNQKNLMHFACHFNSIKCLAYLLSINPSLATQKDIIGEIPLHRACYAGSISCVCLLISNSDINSQNIFKATPLHYVFYQNHKNKAEILKLFLTNNAITNIEDIKGYTVSQLANL